MELNKNIGTLLMRLILGFVFLMQGYGKIFVWGVEGVCNMMLDNEAYSSLPDFLLYFTAYFTTYAELVGGALLVLGLFRDYALYALGAVLVIVTFGHGLEKPIWDLQHVMFRAMLLLPLLLLPAAWDRFRLDTLLKKQH